MLLSKEKIIIAYYYIALIAFALSACVVMFDQESDSGFAQKSIVLVFVFLLWSIFVLRLFVKNYLIEVPSKTIFFFNIYMLIFCKLSMFVISSESSTIPLLLLLHLQ